MIVLWLLVGLICVVYLFQVIYAFIRVCDGDMMGGEFESKKDFLIALIPLYEPLRYLYRKVQELE